MRYKARLCPTHGPPLMIKHYIIRRVAQSRAVGLCLECAFIRR